MAVLKGVDRTLQYEEETTLGVLNGTADMATLLNTGDTFTFSRDTFVSNEITGNRGVTDLNYGNKQSSGNISFELSYLNYDKLLQGALQSTGTFDDVGATIKDGAKLRSFTVQRGYKATPAFYELYTGMCPNTLNLTINTNAQITGSVDFLGMTANNTTADRDSTPTAFTAGGKFNSYTGSIIEGGTGAQTKVSSLTLTLNNNLEALYGLFNDSSFEVTSGKCNITGSMTMYFENKTIAEKFIDGDESSLEFELFNIVNIATVDTKQGYKFKLPRIKYTGADKPVNGEGAIMLTLPFQALYDSTSGVECTISIEKINVAV